MKHHATRRQFLVGAGLTAASMAASRPGFAKSAGEERQTTAGLIRGRAEQDIFIFKGIPFAEPPVGPLRFMPPQPKSPWSGVLETQNFRANALQGPFNLTGVVLPDALNGAGVSEDCLYLNIWTPATPGPHPVLVWIYGGGNIEGGPSQSIYDGANFARNGVVCVTVGYRLGALGFLTLDQYLGPDYAPNMALRDQLMGLRWVQENISRFGGDPARVTVAGESAGGKNVGSLLGASQSAGLFSQAIIESGGGQTVYDRQTSEAVTAMFLQAADIAPSQARRLLEMQPHKILEAQAIVGKYWAGGFPFRPVVDGDFLKRIPVRALQAAGAPRVRMLIGSNKDESSAFVSAAKATEPIMQKELANIALERVSPLIAKYEQIMPQLDAKARRLRMITAEEYWIPNLRLAEAGSAAGADVYMYRFDYSTVAGRRSGLAPHTSELPFVWGNFSDDMIASFVSGDDLPVKKGENILALYDSRAKDLARKIQSAWIAFIKGGAPNADGLANWPRFDSTSRQVMILDGESRIESDPRGDERQIWDDIL